MDNEPSWHSFTIHLSKENQHADSLLTVNDSVTEKSIPVGGRTLGRLFIKPSEAKPPSWADFFDPYVKPSEFGDVRSASAVLLVPVYKRWAAVTFGQGRHLLATDHFEDRFGLRVALNCIDNKKVKTIDKQSFDAIASHTQEQAAREANAREFGFDIERDILRAVTGTPRHKDFGRRLSGMGALNAVVQVELNGLLGLLETYHQKFFDTSYRTDFSWVDQIREIKDSKLEFLLSETLVRLIRKRQLDDRCWLSVPDVLDWSQVSGFRYSRANRQPEVYDIDLSSFLETVEDPEDLSQDLLKNRSVFCMDLNDQVIRRWNVFNCLYC